ncbi:hypothetical protein M5D96_008059, partial [Drosophila gunungcola]
AHKFIHFCLGPPRVCEYIVQGVHSKDISRVRNASGGTERLRVCTVPFCSRNVWVTD